MIKLKQRREVDSDLRASRYPILSSWENNKEPRGETKNAGIERKTKAVSYPGSQVKETGSRRDLCRMFSSVAQLCLTLCDPMNQGGLPVHHQLLESTQTHIHQVGDAIQPSHPLSSPSPPAPNPSQHQGLFQWVSSSHEVAKVLESQLQHQSFQWTPRTDLL